MSLPDAKSSASAAPADPVDLVLLSSLEDEQGRLCSPPGQPMIVNCPVLYAQRWTTWSSQVETQEQQDLGAVAVNASRFDKSQLSNYPVLKDEAKFHLELLAESPAVAAALPAPILRLVASYMAFRGPGSALFVTPEVLTPTAHWDHDWENPLRFTAAALQYHRQTRQVQSDHSAMAALAMNTETGRVSAVWFQGPLDYHASCYALAMLPWGVRSIGQRRRGPNEFSKQ